MAHQPIEELDLFRLFEEVTDWVWAQVSTWSPFATKTIGEQLVRAMDSVNANLVEGDGRYSSADSLRFFIIGRASAREARLWLRRAVKRGLLPDAEATQQIEKLTRAARLLNQLIRYRRNAPLRSVKETQEPYGSIPGSDSSTAALQDPFLGEPNECMP